MNYGIKIKILVYALLAFCLSSTTFTNDLLANDMISLKNGWEYSFDGTTWASTELPCIPKKDHHESKVIFKRNLSTIDQFARPLLYLDIMSQPFEVKVNGKAVYSYLEINSEANQFKGYPWHLIDIAPSTNALLEITVKKNQQAFFGLCKKIYLGERSDIYKEIFRKDLGIFAVSIFLSIAACVALGCSFYARRRKLLASFAYLALSITLWIVSTPEFKSRLFLVSDPEFWMPLSHLGLFSIPIAIGLLLKELFADSVWKAVDGMVVLHILYLSVSVVMVIFGTYDFPKGNFRFNLIVPFTVLLILGNVFYLAFKDKTSARFVSLGFGIFMFVAVHDWLIGMWILNWSSLWLHWGFLVLMIFLGLSVLEAIKSIFISEHAAYTAEEKYKAVQALAQSVAHDVKKPFLLLRLTMARLKECENSEELKRIALENSSAIVSTTNQVDQTLKAFLNLNEESKLFKEEVRVAETIESVIQMHEPQLNRAGITIKRSHGFRGKILADSLKLKRSLGNLVQNAIEAQPNGGTLTITSKQSGSKNIEINVHTPTYIPPKISEKLFDRFFTFGKVDGTGLGLSIVKNFIELHRGRIKCTSTKDLGTSFIITLPKEIT